MNIIERINEARVQSLTTYEKIPNRITMPIRDYRELLHWLLEHPNEPAFSHQTLLPPMVHGMRYKLDLDTCVMRAYFQES